MRNARQQGVYRWTIGEHCAGVIPPKTSISLRAIHFHHLDMSSRGSITLSELVVKLDPLEIKCHRCERHGRVSLARLIEEHGADTGLPDLWQNLADDCEHARATALNNRCAIYYPQLPALFLSSKEA